MKIFERFTLVTKLIAMLVIIVSGLIVLSLSFLISQNTTSSLNKAELSVEKLNVYMLELRKHEKDFLARKKPKYLDSFNKTKENLKTEIGIIQNSFDKNEYLEKLKLITEQYGDKFVELYKIKEQIGFTPKTGLYGTLRDSVHALEGESNVINDKNITVHMLLLGRHEKDFMLRKNEKYIAKFKKEFVKLKKSISNSTKANSVLKAKLMKLSDSYNNDFLALFELEQKGGLDSKSGIHGEMRSIIHEFTKDYESVNEAITGLISSNKVRSRRIAFFIFLVVLIILIFSIIIIIKDVKFKMNYITEFLSKNQNDLTRRIDVSGQDEFSLIGKYINSFIEKLQDTVDIINKNATNLSSMSTELASAVTEVDATVREISSSSNNTRESVESTSSAITEMAANLNELSGNIQTMAEYFNNITTATNTGAEAVGQSVSSMNEIKKSSESIYSIVNVITEIAGQTNLLSLNAAIEAAKAGEQGKGFAVVAEEVRKLAERSGNAAKEIAELIANSTKQVDLGSKIIGTAGESLEDILGKVGETSNIVFEVNTAAEEQTKGVQEIVIASDTISSLAEQNASATEEISATMEEVRRTVEEIANLSFELSSKVEEFIV